MNTKIYNTEIEDGLQEAIASNQTIALNCSILKEDKFDLNNKSFASLTEEDQQKDLYYLNSILVSSGWNKNDDVFNPAYLWAAKDTPVNKQFNYMHEESDIIGHMTASILVNQQGEVITSEDSLVDDIDIITSAVIYKKWSDPRLQARMDSLLQKIDDGELAVSMECLFYDFDYAVIYPDGTHAILSRDEESAFLTKHLRAYGGTGEYEDFKVGRLLKDFYFSGKGLVDNPANPRSVILDKETKPFSNNYTTVSNLLTAMETTMPEQNQELLDLQSELDKAKSSLETYEATLNELKEQVAQLNQEKTELEEKLEASQKECQQYKTDIKNDKRKHALVEAGASDEECTELMAKFSDADEDMFDSIIALIVKKNEVVEEEVEEVEEEVDETVLEEAEEVEASIAPKEDEVEDEPALDSAIAFFRKSLKSTQKLIKE